MDAKTLGWIQLVLNLAALYFVYTGQLNYSVVLVALTFIVTSIHHLTEKNK